MNPSCIVLDFDGTCVTHEFPNVGADIGAAPVLKELIANGHNLILFTMRSDIKNPISEDPDIHLTGGLYLFDALGWFDRNNIKLYGIQTNPRQHTWTTSPKAYGQVIIDDAAIGCPLVYGKHKRPYADWEKIRKILVEMGLL